MEHIILLFVRAKLYCFCTDFFLSYHRGFASTSSTVLNQYFIQTIWDFSSINCMVLLHLAKDEFFECIHYYNNTWTEIGICWYTDECLKMKLHANVKRFGLTITNSSISLSLDCNFIELLIGFETLTSLSNQHVLQHWAHWEVIFKRAQ